MWGPREVSLGSKIKTKKVLEIGSETQTFPWNSAKFIVSHSAYCKLQRDFGFSVLSIILVKAGLIQITITCSPSLAENDSRLFKNSEGNCDGEQIFCQRKEADVALLLQVTRIRKIRKICEANLTSRLFPKTGRSQLKQRTLNTKQTKWITIHQSQITNHDLLNWNK